MIDDVFQSTLSVRRATNQSRIKRLKHSISIHALRKESDLNGTVITYNPEISIHALRKESDLSARIQRRWCQHFNPRSP